ncbi:hypothetical protein D3C72_1838300 [compost metagenome]
MGSETAEVNAIALLPAHQAFHQRVTHPSGEGQAWIATRLDDIQLPAIPGPAHQDLVAGYQRLAEDQPLQVAGSLDRPDGADLRQLRCPIDAAGDHFAPGIAQSTDPDRLADAQAFSHTGSCGDANGLSHHPHWRSARCHSRDRAFIGMEDRDALRFEPSWRFAGLHRHDLANSQLLAADR